MSNGFKFGSRLKTTYQPDIFTIKDLIKKAAEVYGDITAAVINVDENNYEISYKRLWHDVCNVAEIFLGRNVQGKNIGLLSDFNYHWIVMFFAITSSGNVAVPINDYIDDIEDKVKSLNLFYTYVGKEVKNIYKDDLGIIISSDNRGDLNLIDYYNKISNTDLVSSVNKTDDAVIIFTSGTTGISKGVVLTHDNIISDCKCGLYFIEDDLKEEFKVVPVLPITHMFQITAGFLIPVFYGMTFCFGKRFHNYPENIKKFKPNFLVLVPMIINDIHKKIINQAIKKDELNKIKKMVKISNDLRKVGIDLRRVLFKRIREEFGGDIDLILTGGAAVDYKIIQEFDDFGVIIKSGYGITECSPLITGNKTGSRKAGVVGVKGPDGFCDVAIIDNEICVKGDIVFKEYYKDEVSTRKAIVDGWFHTGDMGYIDKDGLIFITGRKNNLIILSDGNNVSPEEIEKKFKCNDLIGEIIVTTKKYDGREYITAFIYPNYRYIERNHIVDIKNEINKAVKEVNINLPVYKRIQKIELVQHEFEKTALGKIKRFSY